MFAIVTKRVVKVNTGATQQYAPRTANQESWTVSGPFSARRGAERAALAALASHTCLAAYVVDAETIGAAYRGAEHQEGRALRRAAEMIGATV